MTIPIIVALIITIAITITVSNTKPIFVQH